MSRGVKVALFICFLCLIGIGSIIYYGMHKIDFSSLKTNNDKDLYKEAANYIQDLDYIELIDSEDGDLPYAHVFIKYDALGIEENGDFTYVYMWVVSQVHYVKYNKLQSASGYSMFKKVTFKKGKIINIEQPKAGGEYTSSVEKLVKNKKIQRRVLYYDNKMTTEEDALEYYISRGIL